MQTTAPQPRTIAPSAGRSSLRRRMWQYRWCYAFLVPSFVLLALHVARSAIDFLGNPHSVMWTAMLIFVWKWLGQPMIYWLAGLQTIPNELYEAARVDGAGWVSQVRHVVAPLMMPFAVIIG